MENALDSLIVQILVDEHNDDSSKLRDDVERLGLSLDILGNLGYPLGLYEEVYIQFRQDQFPDLKPLEHYRDRGTASISEYE